MLSAAELSIGMRGEGISRRVVHKTLWDEAGLIKMCGPRALHTCCRRPICRCGGAQHLTGGRAAEGTAALAQLVERYLHCLRPDDSAELCAPVTVEPLTRLTAAQRADLDAQVKRLEFVFEGTAELTIGTVTVGPHAQPGDHGPNE